MVQHRIDAGTDIACVGIWDAGLPPLRRVPDAKEVEASAVRGEALPIETSADGGYVLEILVEESFVAPAGRTYETLERDYGLNLASGTALVGGFEDFRSRRPQITSEEDLIHVEPSWYRVRVHLNRIDPEYVEALSHDAAERALSPEELARHRQLGRYGNAGCASMLLAVPLFIVAGRSNGATALIALVAGLVLFTAPAWLNRLAKRRGDLELQQRYESTRARATPPDVVLELWRTDAPLPGGRVSLEAAREEQLPSRAARHR
ncbi:hypothetical protein HPC49_03630 [Pyxidicoccus fallax]|uniref:Uncharacterized protein n=1 Tax=Pyxidicoccus fallax TaxID=394095 RepID=A0A848LQX7_9BACT|nr:hypothetical protein [Pyxidicoccus fallax]NMO20079.1 hypothetical protein [Pyxidicoccus fallax]NPC77347.1 hypothetical protein [Pyxidicoccus fallax]